MLNLPFEVRALLGVVDIDAADYQTLRVGDIILLDQKASQPLTLNVGETNRFKAIPGLEGIHKAVKIGSFYE